MENLNNFVNWHKAYADKCMKIFGVDWYTLAWVSWVKGIITGIILMVLLSGCYVTSYTPDPIYEDQPHTTEVYWHTDHEMGGSPYFGYWDNFYYYYGTPHFYPWWYYYQFIPPYNHQTHTHVHVHCDNGHYVYKHRGPKFHNIGPDCPTNNGHFTTEIKLRKPKSKTNVFPHNWKSNNSTRNNKINQQKFNRIIIKDSSNKNTNNKRNNKSNNSRKPRK